ncbi:MAG TPA: hypothetical protein VKZ79_05225 [Alphaproteobacteria bacterium]|nr:hypothetical protein [Alphaproteobacteria bacterium]
MSSFLDGTTSLAYLEFAAARLQASGYLAEIVMSPATGRTVLRVDGAERSLQDISKLLAPGMADRRSGIPLPA